MEEATTTYILTPENERAYNQMKALTQKGKIAQRHEYFRDKGPKLYHATVVADKEDRISIIDKSYRLMMGTNGLFIKQSGEKVGVTYHKKGRSSSRLRYWGSKKIGQYEIVKIIATKINPSTAYLFDNIIIEQVGTQGMYGAIIAGKITNTTEAMAYHIRYSLRGVGIKQEHAESLYNYLDRVRDTWNAKLILRVAKDPNAILDRFHTREFITDSQFVKLLNDVAGRLCTLALATGEKIDWVSKDFNPESEAKRLRFKEQRTEDLLELWKGGPKLKAPLATQSSLNDSFPF